jgi:hypothetical protein
MLANNNPLTEKDIHIALAALRFMQDNLSQLPQEIVEIATDEGRLPLPDGDKLDALCELINFSLPKIPDEK